MSAILPQIHFSDISFVLVISCSTYLLLQVSFFVMRLEKTSKEFYGPQDRPKMTEPTQRASLARRRLICTGIITPDK